MHWQGLQCAVEEVREVRGPLTCMLGPRRPLCWWCCRWANVSLGLCTPAILAWCLRSWMRSRVSSSGCSRARCLGAGGQREERKYLRTIWAVQRLGYSSWESHVFERPVYFSLMSFIISLIIINNKLELHYVAWEDDFLCYQGLSEDKSYQNW